MTKRSSADLRAAILNKTAKEDIEEFDLEDDDDLDTEGFDEEEIEELVGELVDVEDCQPEEPSVQELVGMIHEDGVVAFMDGLAEEENPYTTDDQDFQDVWSGGWVEAYTHACVTDLVLSVQGLLEAKDADAGKAALSRLEESFGNVAEVLPLEECEEFWAAMQEE